MKHMIGLIALRNVEVDCLEMQLHVPLTRSLNILFRNLYFMYFSLLCNLCMILILPRSDDNIQTQKTTQKV